MSSTDADANVACVKVTQTHEGEEHIFAVIYPTTDKGKLQAVGTALRWYVSRTVPLQRRGLYAMLKAICSEQELDELGDLP